MGNYCSNRKLVYVSKEAFVPLPNDGTEDTEMKLLAFELGDELTTKVGFNVMSLITQKILNKSFYFNLNFRI